MFQIFSHIYEFFFSISWSNDTIVIACALADLRGRKGRAPPGVQILSISCSFGKIWQNCMLSAPWRVGAPTSEKSWIRHCLCDLTFAVFTYKVLLLYRLNTPQYFHSANNFPWIFADNSCRKPEQFEAKYFKFLPNFSKIYCMRLLDFKKNQFEQVPI